MIHKTLITILSLTLCAASHAGDLKYALIFPPTFSSLSTGTETDRSTDFVNNTGQTMYIRRLTMQAFLPAGLPPNRYGNVYVQRHSDRAWLDYLRFDTNSIHWEREDDFGLNYFELLPGDRLEFYGHTDGWTNPVTTAAYLWYTETP